MTKKLGIFDVNDALGLDLSDTFKDSKQNSITVKRALDVVISQMKANNLRERTISDYTLHFNSFIESQNIKYTDEITIDSIYNWLDSMNVKAVTKNSRLKCVKAILSRFRYNGFIATDFHKTIVVRTDKAVKRGAKPSDLALLISKIDKTSFIGYRDVVAILLIYRTGIRSLTLTKLEEKHIDLDNLCLALDGEIMKNRKALKLPIDETLAEMLKNLMQMNDKVRRYYGEKNSYVFVTNKGKNIRMDASSSAITKQLYKYSKKYGLENINAHSIRRAFSKNLLDKGCNVALISKALSHSDLKTTTRYLQLDEEEVFESLRDYM